MRIVTKYQTDSNGAGQIVAKAGGRQRTVTYDHSLSPFFNHRDAAATLANQVYAITVETFNNMAVCLDDDSGSAIFLV